MAVALATTIAGCGSSDGNVDVGPDGGGSTGVTISTGTLSGKIGGRDWTFAAGQTVAALSTADRIWVDLYATTFDACVGFGAPTNADEVIMMMPRTPGDYAVTLNLNATLYDAAGNSNNVATRGRLVIDSITATEITGGLHITYNGDNTVDGQFQATICP